MRLSIAEDEDEEIDAQRNYPDLSLDKINQASLEM